MESLLEFAKEGCNRGGASPRLLVVVNQVQHQSYKGEALVQTMEATQSRGRNKGRDIGVMVAQRGHIVRHSNDYGIGKAPQIVGTISAKWKGGNGKLAIGLAKDGMHCTLLDV